MSGFVVPLRSNLAVDRHVDRIVLLPNRPLVPPPSQHKVFSPSPATSMKATLSVQQQRSTILNGYGLADTRSISPSPPPSEDMVLRSNRSRPLFRHRPGRAISAPAESIGVQLRLAAPVPAGKRSKTVEMSSGPAPLPASAVATGQVPRSTSFHGAPLPVDGAAADIKVAPNLLSFGAVTANPDAAVDGFGGPRCANALAAAAVVARLVTLFQRKRADRR
jgi:hypothetical protein